MKKITLKKYGKEKELSLEEFQKEWDWTISQFRGLATYGYGFDEYRANFETLEKVAREMIENAFNDTYKVQKHKAVLDKGLPFKEKGKW
jgi:hypothetical protein